MSDDATPAKVRLTDGLGPLPTPAAETMMDLCADHEGPVEAWQYLPADAMLYTANQMRDYAAQEVAAAIERVISERDKLRAALGSIHWRVARSDTAFDDFAAAVLTEVCEQAYPELRALGPNVGGEARLAAHRPSHTTTATPQGVASTDQLGRASEARN